MKWSWKIGRFAGIDVNVHTTFLLLIGWIGVSSWIQEDSIAAVVSGVGFILALFASVVLHEYGHALTARRFGVKTHDITLYPIGGVARLERIPEIPVQELWVALAGPAVNLVIAALLFAGLLLTAAFEPLSSLTLTTGSFVERLMVTNLVLVAFNMIPAFPMDGGRVLRSLLAMRLEYTRATRIAASVGQWLAVAFGIVGILSNPFLVFIAVFVWIGARGESQMVRMKSGLQGIPVSRAMITDFQSLHPDDSIAMVSSQALVGSQRVFPVVEAGRLVGTVTKTDMLVAMRELGEFTLVRSVMSRTLEAVQASDMLDTVFRRLQSGEVKALPVMVHERLAGLVSLDSIAEFVRIRSLLDSRKALASS